MSAQTRSRIKRHEPKWLCLGGINHLPDIDAHRAVNDLEFVDEGDVDAAENIFEELDRLRDAARGNRHDRLDGKTVERLGFFKTSRRITAHNFGNVSHPAAGIAG